MMAGKPARKKRPRRERRRRSEAGLPVVPADGAEPEQVTAAGDALAETDPTADAAEPVAPAGPSAPEPECPGPPEPAVTPDVIELADDAGDAGDEEVEEPGDEDEGDEKKYRRGLFRSRRVLSRPCARAATRKAIDPEFWNEAEEALIAADTGVAAATEIVELARRAILKGGIRDMEGLKQAFRDVVVEMLLSFGEPPEPPEGTPHVLFVVGVNGVGKTTTCAKLGFGLKQEGKKILYAAADTFRAAGIEQMEMWANRIGAPVVRHRLGGDPAAVVFDAIESAQARGIDVVIVDTAGRLHTKKNLMEELGKMWRVAERQMESPPHSLLVIDGTTGQNGVAQARIFNEALEVGSIALTKMDGSAKGGVVIAIGRELVIPVSYIGVGEGMADLRPFDAEEYSRALF